MQLRVRSELKNWCPSRRTLFVGFCTRRTKATTTALVVGAEDDSGDDVSVAIKESVFRTSEPNLIYGFDCRSSSSVVLRTNPKGGRRQLQQWYS